jgi:hypothetical protein
MKPKTKPSPDKNQSAKFKAAARELGCDEDEAAFEKRLRKIAKAAPPKDVSPKRIKPKRAT